MRTPPLAAVCVRDGRTGYVCHACPVPTWHDLTGLPLGDVIDGARRHLRGHHPTSVRRWCRRARELRLAA